LDLPHIDRPVMNHLYNGDNLQILREHIRDESVDHVYLPDPPFISQGIRRGFRTSKLLLLAAALTITVCNSRADDLNPSAPAISDTDLAKKLVVQITNDKWTAEKVLIATGTLTNTNAVPVTVTNIEATGFDAQLVAIRNQLDPGEGGYTIANPEIAAGGTVIFKVALTAPCRIDGMPSNRLNATSSALAAVFTHEGILNRLNRSVV
jgi:hypothetical protein